MFPPTAPLLCGSICRGRRESQFHKVTGYGNRRPLQDKLSELDHPYHNRVSIMVRPGRRKLIMADAKFTPFGNELDADPPRNL